MNHNIQHKHTPFGFNPYILGKVAHAIFKVNQEEKVNKLCETKKLIYSHT